MLVDNLTRSVINSGFFIAGIFRKICKSCLKLCPSSGPADPRQWNYCASEIRTCTPPRVSTVGGEDDM